MTLCYDGHMEIVYESRNCPLCDAIRNQVVMIAFKDELEEENKELEKEVEILRNEVEKTQDESLQFKSLIADLENKVDRLGGDK